MFCISSYLWIWYSHSISKQPGSRQYEIHMTANTKTWIQCKSVTRRQSIVIGLRGNAWRKAWRKNLKLLEFSCYIFSHRRRMSLTVKIYHTLIMNMTYLGRSGSNLIGWGGLLGSCQNGAERQTNINISECIKTYITDRNSICALLYSFFCKLYVVFPWLLPAWQNCSACEKQQHF